MLLIGSMKLISGIHIEGWRWGHREAPPDVEWDFRVTHYSVEFSPDGRLWTVIKDENGLPRVLLGCFFSPNLYCKWIGKC